MHRRRLLAGIGAACGSAFAGCLGDDHERDTPSSSTPSATPGTDRQPQALGLEPIANGLPAPTDIVFLSDDEALVATQPGVVHHLDLKSGASRIALDLTGRIVAGGERGLLGLALHPNVAETDRLFVRYSAPSRVNTPPGYSHTFVLAEFAVGTDRRSISADTERPVLEIPQPQANHNSGVVLFGPDGYLHVGTGDGGAAGDVGPGHAEDWYEANAGGNGQDTGENLLGGMLRLDVDHSGAPGGYAIPPDNPLVDLAGHLDEYFAWGLRNPWGASVDDGQLFVGDVGQIRREEVNIVEMGGNYGWNVKEGTSCFSTAEHGAVTEDCPDATPPTVRGGEPLLDPIVEYPNATPTTGSVNGVAVTGGAVYRGSRLPGLSGRYVFGDLQPAGRLFVATPAEEPGYRTEWVATPIPLTDEAAEALDRVLSFGRGPDGELYVLGGGSVFRLTPP